MKTTILPMTRFTLAAFLVAMVVVSALPARAQDDEPQPYSSQDEQQPYSSQQDDEQAYPQPQQEQRDPQAPRYQTQKEDDQGLSPAYSGHACAPDDAQCQDNEDDDDTYGGR
jgi:hypothetical protein